MDLHTESGSHELYVKDQDILQHVGTPVIVEDGVQQDKHPCGLAHTEW